MCDNSNLDDNISPNMYGIGVHLDPESCSQTLDSNVESASRLVAPIVGEHPEPHTTPTASINDPLFNAASKAPHLDAMVVKQEAGWFQLWEEKRKQKTKEKLVAKQEMERLAKEAEDAKNQVGFMKQLLEQ